MARFEGGWIKAWRRVAGSDLVDNVYVWGLWHWLLYSATWKPTKILWDGKQKVLQPGQVVFGLRELSEKWGCSRETMRRWVSYLRDTGRISVESGTRGYIVTIENWDSYQARDESDVTPAGQARDAGLKQTGCEPTLNEEYKNTRREEEREITLSPDILKPCIEAWGKTLARHKVHKDPKLDEVNIARLVKRHGPEKTRLALLGAGFEEESPTYNPSKHISILRLFELKNFETFVNLGAQNQSLRRRTAADSDPKEAAC